MPALREGQRFERYRVIRLLGSGVAGESYEAEDTLLLRKVVLKLLHPWAPLSDAARRQFFREMQGISQLTHRYLAPVLDYGELHGNLYVARRLFSSGSLLNSDGRLWFSPPLELSAVVSYTQQLAQALQHVHHAGYLHGGLSLTNIMVLRGPNVEGASDYAPFMLADVGLTHFVRRFGRLQRPILPVTAAPEQLGGRATQASDQFALAVIVYTWITGRPPYLGLPEEIAQAKLSESFPSLLSLNPQIPVEIEGVIRRALSVYPEDRYPSVLAFAEALQQAAPRPAVPLSSPPEREEQGAALDVGKVERPPANQSEVAAAMVTGEDRGAVAEVLATPLPVTAPEGLAEAGLPEEGMSAEHAEVRAVSLERATTQEDEVAAAEQSGQRLAAALPVAEMQATIGTSLTDDGLPASGDAGRSLPPLPQSQQEAEGRAEQPQVIAGEEDGPAAEPLTSGEETAPVQPEQGTAPPTTGPEDERGAEVVPGEITTRQTGDFSPSGSALTYFETLLQATRSPGPDVSISDRAGQAAASAATEAAALAPEIAVTVVAGQERVSQREAEAAIVPPVAVELPPQSPVEVSLLEVLSGLHGRSAADSVSEAQGQQKAAEVAAIADAAPPLLAANGTQAKEACEEASAARDGGEEEHQEGEPGRLEEEREKVRREPAPASAEGAPLVAAPAYILVLPPATAGRQATIVELAAAEISIGRAGDSGILLEGDRRVSRRHAFLRRAGTELLIQDGDNAEGVFINGQRLEQRGSQVLRSGDRIRLGDHELIVCQSWEEAQQLQQERSISNGQSSM
ncbi:protein kinase domain-containing protein [Thermogemmatispora carboxidivorans]|uniref:protein kinase domain-containing protein n=1 Tax=Thermogemmatispora carboxidivorans TaxID=1382306 RepID=UPI00069C8CA9|nr:FHA domain-containing protein [Thermogemmatispora carboxidivorans]